MNMIILQDSGKSGEKLQDDVTTTKHIVVCTILVDTTVKNKASSFLLNVILDSRITPYTTHN